MLAEGASMGAGQSPGSSGGEAKKLTSSLRPPSEATIRLSASEQERETLSRLRATLPPLEPVSGEMPVLREPAQVGSEGVLSCEPARERARETPHTIVLPSTSRADRATLTVLRGPGIGTTFRVEREAVLGRGAKADILLDEPSVSREHARVSRDGEGDYFIEDLGSTNGTFLAGRPVQRSRLKSGDRLQIGCEHFLRFALVDEDEEKLQRRLYESSMRDTLTGLVNRRCLFDQLATAIERSRRDGVDVGIFIVDVDYFKSVNDKFGHAAGDEVLRAIAIAGGRELGGSDVFARYGGEEFAVLTRCAGRADVIELAERFASGIGELRVKVGDGAIGVTVSIGVALLSECSIVDALELFARADARLYAAKLAGRNRVCAVE
jgi:two-component system cell cycle response regulator